MFILKLSLKRFKKFKDNLFEFSPKINLILGPNESGKTTLQNAILKSLFLKPSAREVEKLISWGETQLPEVELEIMNQERRIVIYKNFDSQKAELREQKANYTNYNKIQEKLFELMGIDDEFLFLDSACLAQNQLSKGIIERPEFLMERLQKQIYSLGGINLDELYKELEEKYDEIYRGWEHPAKKENWGILKTLDEKLKEAQAKEREKSEEFNRKIEAFDKKERVIRERASLENERGLLEQRLRELQNILDKNLELRKLRKEEKDLNEKVRSLQKAQELQIQITEREKEFEEFRDYKQKFGLLEQFKEIEEKLKRLRDEEKIFQQKNELIARKVLISFARIGFALLSFGFGIYFAKGTTSSSPHIFFLLLVLAGIAYWLIHPAVRNLYQYWKERKSRFNLISEQRAKLEADYKEIEKKLAPYNISELSQKFEAFKELDRQINQWKIRIGDLVPELSPEQIKKQYENVLIEFRANRVAIENLTQYQLEPEELSKFENEYNQIKEKLNEIQTKIENSRLEEKKLETIIEQTKITAEDINWLKQETEILKAEIERKKFQLNVISEIIKGIDEAKTKLYEQAVPKLEKAISPLISHITRKRYEDIKISPNLEIELKSKEKNDFVKLYELSLATQEQVWLSFRLSLSKLLTDKNLPLILDDPFAHFDDERLSSTLELIKEFSKDHQIFIFSPSKKYAEFFSGEEAKVIYL